MTEPEHGDYQFDYKSQSDFWYCSVWMCRQEWLEIHGYEPSRCEVGNSKCPKQKGEHDKYHSIVGTNNS